MALIVEDGSGVPNAVSFASVEDIRQYAALRGGVLPDNDEAIEVHAIAAADFLNALEWTGFPSHDHQSMAWPRSGVVYRGGYMSTMIVPTAVINAQSQLVLDLINGVQLYSTEAAPVIKRKKIGQIEREYFDTSAHSSASPILKAMNFIRPLLRPQVGLRVDRG